MSPLPKLLKNHLFPALLNAFAAWALCMAALDSLGLREEALLAALYALGAGVLISLYGSLRKPARILVPLAVLAWLVLAASLLKGSLPARALALLRSLLSGAPARGAATLYLDALLPLMAVLFALYARLLMEGDPAFTLPMMVAPVLLLWHLGPREQVSAYLPSALALPLMYLYISHQPDEGPVQKPPRAYLLRGAAIALSLALLASLLTPAQRRTQPRAEKMADEIRRRIEDLFFFTATRNMFSLSTYGYQPMGENGLGGTPDISLASLMTVQSERRVYLRGTALDTYSGRAWYDTLSSQRYGWQSPRWAGLKDDLFDLNLPREERIEAQEASVTVLENMASTLFVPQRLRTLTPGPDMVPYFNASSEVFITRDLKNGDAYSFRFEPYIAGEARTDALGARLSQTAGDAASLPPEYTKLPQHLQPDGIVAELAREIAGAESDPYRQALAIMRYLKANYSYATQVPDAPENQDFAAHFLFDQQTGYCTYFATAMTVLARSLGLPARYVEGFLADPQGQGSVSLNGTNAHAWTEVYINGLGWVIFDATPGENEGSGENGNPPPPGQQPSPSPSPSPSPPPPGQEPSPEAQDSPSPPPGESTPAPTEAPPTGQPPAGGKGPDRPFPWWILIILALIALLAWRVREEEPGRRARKLRQPGEVLALYWHTLLQTKQVGGHGILPQETPLSYAHRMETGGQGLMDLAIARSAQVYGRRAPDAMEAELAGSLYRDAWRALPPHKKAALALLRAVQPLAGRLKKAVSSLSGRRAEKQA